MLLLHVQTTNILFDCWPMRWPSTKHINKSLLYQYSRDLVMYFLTWYCKAALADMSTYKRSLLDDSVGSKNRLLPPLLTVHLLGLSVVKTERIQVCLGAADLEIAQREGGSIHGSLRSEVACVASSTSRYSLSCVQHDQCCACCFWSPRSLFDL